MSVFTKVPRDGIHLTAHTDAKAQLTSPQDRGMAVRDGTEHFLVRPVNPAAVAGEEAFALRPYDIPQIMTLLRSI